MSTHQPSPGPSTQPSSAKHKQKHHTAAIGIAAGAEDAKYQAKYKDLKRKVKEIETDNDKLHFKVLQAKRSIQRMKLEQAILYERLSGAAQPAEALDRHSNPSNHSVPDHAHSTAYPHHDMRDSHSRTEPGRSTSEYTVPHDRPRMLSAHDAHSIGSGVAPSPHLSVMHSPPRHRTNEVYDSARHLPHMPPLPPVPQIDTSRSYGHSRSHLSPTTRHPHPSSSHHHVRSPPSRHASAQAYLPPQAQHYPQSMPSGQRVMHSPPIVERERSRRHDAREFPALHGDPHGNGRHSGYPSHHSPPMHSSEVRSSNRVHRHQRMGPGTYINQEEPGTYINPEEHYDVQRDFDREPDWHREREVRDHQRRRDVGRGRDVSGSHILSPHLVQRTRQPVDRGDFSEHHVSSRRGEDQIYYRDRPPVPTNSYPIHSRSGSPGEGSGIGPGEGPSRPDSRPHYYDPDRAFKLRPVNKPNEDMDFVNDDGRPTCDRGGGGGIYPPQEQSRSSLESRKRGRNDMDVDSDDGPDGPMHSGGRLSEDRSSKRYHREHLNKQKEDSRMSMGPP